MDQEWRPGESSSWNGKELVINGKTIQLTLTADQAHELLIILYDEQRDAIFEAARAADQQ
jgi:hypothetical protein